MPHFVLSPVIDEAHKLRNVYRQSSKTSHAVRDALTTTKKLLLTATPFQNSLLELYGLTSIIDDHIFGSEKSFRSEYGSGENNADLRARLSTMYKRTLRRDVKEYILKSATTRLYDTEAKIICIVSKKGAQCIECHHKDI